MKNTNTLIYTLIVIFISSYSQAQDIQSSTQGFSISLNAHVESWNSDSFFFGNLDEIEPSGTGFGLKFGYGISQSLEFHLAYNAASYNQEFDWDSYNQSRLQLGACYIFGATLRKLRPFVNAGISFNKLRIDPITFDGFSSFELQSSGVGASVGGGVKFFIKEFLSISAAGEVNFGSFNSTHLSGMEINNIEENLDFTITTIQIGVSYYFE